MQSDRQFDRRAADRNVNFPINDAKGNYVGEDRRSGLDRRNYKTDSIAVDIIDSISL